jgi:hypothetical protein
MKWACVWYGSVLMTLLGDPMDPWLIHRTSAWAEVSGDGGDSRPRVAAETREPNRPHAGLQRGTCLLIVRLMCRVAGAMNPSVVRPLARWFADGTRGQR